jgi:uncharacterized integral membrane protein
MNNDPENFSQPPIARLILLAVAIACIAAILVQNLQPLVTVYFLGRSTIPIPLSLAILAAFLSGAISAAIANSISSWLSRSNADQADTIDSAPNNKDTAPKETRRSQVKEEKKVEDSTTAYPRSPSDRTTKLQDDDYDDDDDDDRDEIFVKYIKR